MTSDEAKGYAYIGAAVVVAWLAYRMVSGASSAAQAAGNVISTGASVANDVTAGVVGGIGSVFGLPTPGETIDDPAVVRYLIDTQGHMVASQWGTAMAYFRALTMPEGSGRPPGAAPSVVSQDVARRVSSQSADIQLGDTSGSILSGPSFDSIKNGGVWY